MYTVNESMYLFNRLYITSDATNKLKQTIKILMLRIQYTSVHMLHIY